MKALAYAISGILVALSTGETSASADAALSPAGDVEATARIQVSSGAEAVIRRQLKAVAYSPLLRTAADKTPFSQFPDHFTQDRPGPFSNFSKGSVPDRVNPDPLLRQRPSPVLRQEQLKQLRQVERLRNLQRRQNGSETAAIDVQSTFEKFKMT